MADGLQSYMRMGNIFGPPKPKTTNIFGPPNPPPGSINLDQPSLTNAFTNPPMAGPSEEIPTIPSRTFGGQYPEPPQEPSIWDKFYESVMNPPKREHMTYPDSTLNVMNAALKLAAEPSPLAKNRVIVDGQRYQKQKWFEDPETKERRFVTDVEEPKFMDQVMKAWSAQGTAPTDILNQPYKDAIEDWKLRTEGLKTVAGAEAQAALAAQRQSQVPYNLQRPGFEQQKIDISRLTAEERVRYSQLNTLTDAQKIELLQAGRITLADLNNAAAYARVLEQQAGANQRTQATQAGATTRTGMTQAGANQRAANAIAAARERVRMQQEGATARTQMNVNARGGTVSQTQRRVAEQNAVSDLINEMPEIAESIGYDQNGFVVVSPDLDPADRQYILDEIARRTGQPPVSLGNVPTPPPAPNLPQAAPATPPLPPSNIPAPGRGTPPPATPPQAGKTPTTGKVRVVRIKDGQTGTWDYSAGPIPPEYKVIGQ